MELAYPEVLQYLHSVLLLDGNATKWSYEDTEQSAEDAEFIENLDI